jgi:arylsulfatase A-like enzyme
MFELGWRTPLVFNWPGTIPAGAVHPGLVSTVDLFPTLLDYAAAAPVANRPGRSLKPALAGEASSLRTTLYGSDRGIRPRVYAKSGAPPGPRAPAFFARSKRWHYIWNTETGDESLYDVLEDPSEERDVASHHPGLMRRFRSEITTWNETVQQPLLPPSP